MADKLTTEEILALCRRQDGGDQSTPATPATKPVKAEPVAAEPLAPGGDAVEPASAPKAPPAPAKPLATPSSTADILAAARAQKAAGTAPAAQPAVAKPAAPASTPKTPAEIMAAARAQVGGGTVTPAAPTEKAPKAPAAKPAAPAAKLSVAEMLAAARGEVKPGGGAVTPAAAPAHGTKPAKEKLALPPIPQKPPREAPVVAAAKAKNKQDRRGFLGTVTSAVFVAWAAFIATTTAATLGLARFMFPNVLVEPPSKFKVGPPSDFPLNTVSNKYKAQYGVWIVHTDSYAGKNLIYALSTVCTHLGCTPNWLDGEQKYKCPCHGSGFYMNGINFEGPAPRPLERVAITVAADGNLEVDKSKKFQEELGQWTDATSFVEIA